MNKNIEYENLSKLNLPFFEAFQEKSQQIITSGWYILGNEVTQFEQAFARYIGSQYCIGVASGLDALIVALLALELPPKSEVILSANAYVACIFSILKADL